MTCVLQCKKWPKIESNPEPKTVQRDGGRPERNGVPEWKSEQGAQRDQQVSHRPGPGGLHQLL